LLQGFPDTFRAFVGHKEACDETPPGTILLASSAACPVHMFRLKTNMYATQFHPEADAEGFIVRIKIYKHYGYFRAEDAEKLIHKIKDEKTPFAHKILMRFVKRYRSSS